MKTSNRMASLPIASSNHDARELCIHRGQPTTPPSGDRTGRAWSYCDHPKKPLGEKVCGCRGCGPGCVKYGIAAPNRITRIDSARLAPAVDGRRFNGSIFDWQGQRLLAYRVAWQPSRIHIAVLGDDLQPISTTPVILQHPKCAGGQEDPRLCSLNGRLHLQFAGLSWSTGGSLNCSVMLARLYDDLTPEKIWEPKYVKRTSIEKNWGPFEAEGSQWVVYSITPHKVLKLDMLAGVATEAYESPGPLPWSGGLLRGGAPPVRVGDVFYSWFHGWKRTGDFYTYSAGCYTFSAKPPFRPLRITPGPVWQPDTTLDHLNCPDDRSVIYPAGAVLTDRGQWLVSAGHQDSFVEIGEYDKDELDSLMVPVETPA